MSSKNDDPKWKKFERLVAALHKNEQEGAIVKWDEKINGRQFDVSVRFKIGLYEYLTVIECKDYNRPINVEKIDALATKYKDAKADKAVMVSTNGYQKKAKEVAEKHNITLLTLKSVNNNSHNEDLSFKPILSIFNTRFIVNIDNSLGLFILPEETGIFRSIMRSIKITDGNNEITPERIIENNITRIYEVATSFPQSFIIPFDNGTEITHPNTLEKIKAVCFEFEFVLDSHIRLDEGFGYSNDPYLSNDIYQFKDELSNETKFIDFSKIQLGFDTVLETDKFYLNPNLNFYYYCFNIANGFAYLYLIESYQHQTLIQATVKIKLSNTTQFVEVSNDEDILRLHKLLEEYKKEFNLD